MRRVELIGPPGVGKTTVLELLLRALQRRGHAAASPRWLPLWSCHDRHGFSAARRGVETTLYRMKGLHRWMRPKLEKGLIRHEFRRLREAPPPWPDFLRLGLQQGADTAAEPALALERVRSFIASAALAWAADRLPGDVAIVFDEGLGQRAISLGQHASGEETRAYFNLLPAPAAVVLLSAPADVIQQRLRQRNPNVTRFHEMVEQALHICDTAAEVLPERGIPVVVADGSGPLGDAAECVAEQLDAVLSRPAASAPAR